jgi:hypothetical protein
LVRGHGDQNETGPQNKEYPSYLPIPRTELLVSMNQATEYSCVHIFHSPGGITRLPHAFLDVEKISNDIIAKVFYFILSHFPSLFGSCGLKFEKKNLFIRRKIVFLKEVPFGIKNSDLFAGLIFIF